MPGLPPFNIKTNINDAPHVVILGAGASLAACPSGDANGRRLPLMKNLVQVLGAEEILDSFEVYQYRNDFEALYDSLVSEGGYDKLIEILEDKIRGYFSGLLLPEGPTIYDLLLLSLRKKDVIATFNWDPFLAQAYKRNRHITELPEILFLHGNVDVGLCPEHKVKGFFENQCHVCKKQLERTPLLFPVSNKNYSINPFIAQEWECLQKRMETCYLITVFGYSAPVTDVEARSLLLSKWNENRTRDLAEFEIIDIRNKNEIINSWSDFFVREHFAIFEKIGSSLSFNNVRRSCESFAMATLQQTPWDENRFPEFKTLDELYEWIQPLIKEEAEGYFSGNQC